MSLVVSALLLYSSGIFANVLTTIPNNVGEVVDKYISNMQQQNSKGIQDMIKSKDIGYDAKIYNYEFVNEFAYQVLGEPPAVSANDIIASQYEYIKEKFGADSWENVTYDIVKQNCPSKKEEYINTETGQIISEKESIDIAESYWKNFAAEKGVKYEDFLNIKEYSGELNEKEDMNILVAQELGYKPPVRVNLVDEYDFYVVYLSFNGKTETENGENSFKICIDNKDNILKICCGLCWFVPLSEENMGDI